MDLNYDDDEMDLEFDDDTALVLSDMVEIGGPDERDEVVVWARGVARYYTLH